MYEYFSKNIVGRDFVTGDIHGCFNRLQIELYTVQFNPAVDRLFAVGDLVDRGPDHYQLLEWLEKPWFHSVRGNHEQMLIDSVMAPKDNELYMFHYQNGGDWLYDWPEYYQIEIAQALDKLPYQIEVETDGGSVGIIHADVPYYDWIVTHQEIALGNDKVKAGAVWSRTRHLVKLDIPVKNIDKVYVGHSVVKKELVLANVHLIDGGMGFSGGTCILVQIQ